MKTLTDFAQKMLPDLLIAASAILVFIFMGLCVFLAILAENWHSMKKRRGEPLKGPQLIRLSIVGTGKGYTYRPVRRPGWPMKMLPNSASVACRPAPPIDFDHAPDIPVTLDDIPRRQSSQAVPRPHPVKALTPAVQNAHG